MPRRRASAQRSVQNSAQAVLGQDGAAILQQLVGVGQLDLPQFRIAECHDGPFAARVDHDVRDRRHQVGHADDVLGVDALIRELVEDVPARGFAGVAHRSADRGAAAETHDSDRRVERVAAADFLEMAGIHLEAAGRQFLDTKCQVAHRHADAQDARRDFGAAVWKFMPRSVMPVPLSAGTKVPTQSTDRASSPLCSCGRAPCTQRPSK